VEKCQTNVAVYRCIVPGMQSSASVLDYRHNRHNDATMICKIDYLLLHLPTMISTVSLRFPSLFLNSHLVHGHSQGAHRETTNHTENYYLV